MNTACPYCNSSVPLPADLPPNQRVICPRCIESFPLTGELRSTLTGNATATAQPIATPSSQNRRSSNRRLGFALIAFMLILAGSIAVILSTTRADRHLTNLGELPTLGYLPSDSNVIAAMNLIEADKTPEGQETLERLGLGSNLNLENLIGLNRSQIEHVAIGMNVSSSLIPRVVIAVRTRDAYDFDAVRSKLGSKGTKKIEGNREYDLIQPPSLLLECTLWRPSPQTLVICYPENDFQKVPAEPTADTNRFAKPIAELLTFRTDRGTFLWLVAHSDTWEKIGPLKLLPRIDPQILTDLRTIGLGVRMDSGQRIKRSRPARITEEVDPAARGIVLDLVIEAAVGTEMNPIEDALDELVQQTRPAYA